MQLYTHRNGIVIFGKIKEARLLLAEYALMYRTVQELIGKILN
ncbi:Z-ring formation inhibitor MciZ [Pelotomaculum terephthalicicum JT]|nr:MULTISPECIES: Z-ring formation inhibitor MciZ [Pelotomaculum]MCG9968809.1 Z-ring formation inhibitor MciZ [Pelotomaculum terephthalicicum JT]OPX89758.1 MAG: hypothetical protein A4E54_00837 [Pelotomaculum sp. PtaB.Bin117]OPY63462.1 MAG: hypothetical protein A4E56_00573 [Pelotomaculum sp. PtaU1.Bin065]